MTADQALSTLLAPPEAGLPVVAQTIATASEVEVGAHSSPQRYMYAHAMRGEVMQHVRTQASQADRDRLPAILADWDALRARVNAITVREAGLADTITISELPATAKSFATATLADPLVSKSFGGLSHEIAMAEIDKIVFPQRMINDEYATRLANTYPTSHGLDDLLQICVAPRIAMEPIQHLEVAPNTHVFTSPNTDLRFLGAFVKESVSDEDIPLVEGGGLPAAGVAGFVGYGSPVISAFRVGTRLILNNGHHRVYALHKLGATTIPILIMNLSNPVAELPPAIAGIPRELLMTPRPPLAKDIVDDALNINLLVKRRIKQLTIMMSVNQYDIPV
jgi:hypothetical protein